MGVDLATERAGFAEMEDVNFSDSEFVCHVRDALRSVTLEGGWCIRAPRRGPVDPNVLLLERESKGYVGLLFIS
ncbi:unnamed protein product [Camellia sinensis]